jgi:hypothetical protein
MRCESLFVERIFSSRKSFAGIGGNEKVRRCKPRIKGANSRRSELGSATVGRREVDRLPAAGTVLGADGRAFALPLGDGPLLQQSAGEEVLLPGGDQLPKLRLGCGDAGRDVLEAGLQPVEALAHVAEDLGEEATARPGGFEATSAQATEEQRHCAQEAQRQQDLPQRGPRGHRHGGGFLTSGAGSSSRCSRCSRASPRPFKDSATDGSSLAAKKSANPRT